MFHARRREERRNAEAASAALDGWHFLFHHQIRTLEERSIADSDR
jgi:hypothetical protein